MSKDRQSARVRGFAEAQPLGARMEESCRQAYSHRYLLLTLMHLLLAFPLVDATLEIYLFFLLRGVMEYDLFCLSNLFLLSKLVNNKLQHLHLDNMPNEAVFDLHRLTHRHQCHANVRKLLQKLHLLALQRGLVRDPLSFLHSALHHICVIILLHEAHH